MEILWLCGSRFNIQIRKKDSINLNSINESEKRERFISLFFSSQCLEHCATAKHLLDNTSLEHVDHLQSSEVEQPKNELVEVSQWRNRQRKNSFDDSEATIFEVQEIDSCLCN